MNSPDILTQQVRELYERHPYPGKSAGNGLILDVANAIQFLAPDGALKNRRVLDAGCGTGHRLIGLAQAFPGASFVGVDICASSLAEARQLARTHGARNVEFLQADLLAPLAGSYDWIVSTGVLHHLADPGLCLRQLCGALEPDGVLFLWLYHKYGEFPRMLDQELALLFWESLGRPAAGRPELLRRLGLSLSPERYGTVSSRPRAGADQNAIDVDAFLHPLVRVYDFEETFQLLHECGANWLAPNSLHWPQHSKLVDLGRVHDDAYLTLTAKDLFQDRSIQQSFEAMDPGRRLRTMELATRPTGFTVLAGRNRSYEQLERRITGNLLPQAGYVDAPPK
jgi:SAM-dependent methyltransferase